VKLCTPVHGLSVCLIAEKPESPCTGVHIFTFALKSRPIWLLYQSRPISIFQLNKLVERTVDQIVEFWLILPSPWLYDKVIETTELFSLFWKILEAR